MYLYLIGYITIFDWFFHRPPEAGHYISFYLKTSLELCAFVIPIGNLIRPKHCSSTSKNTRWNKLIFELISQHAELINNLASKQFG